MIRVIRLLEYEFADNEVAERSMALWAVPQNGTRNFGTVSNPRIVRSATIVDLTFEPKESTEVGKQIFVARGPNGEAIHVDMSAPNLIANDDGEPIGIVTGYNPTGIGEMIVQYFDGSADSAFVKELNFFNGEDAARRYCAAKPLRG